jgi:hypothetical protein
MRTQSAAAADHSLAVNYEPVCDHGDDVANVTVLANSQLQVRFGDGTSGVVDMGPLVSSAEAGVFAELSDETLFSKAFVSMGAVTWPTGQDLAPDAMYDALRRDGKWTPR